MTARFFVPGAHERGERVEIDGGDAHHITNVLRLHAGDRIEIVDSAARAFLGRIESDGVVIVVDLVEEREALPRSPLTVDVAQALPKASKMDYVVEKLTELGASAIYPFTSERTIAHAAGNEKLARWRRIARSASEQSGRRDVPSVADPLAFSQLLEHFKEYDVVLFAWESASDAPLRTQLPALLQSARRVLVVIGPEGGFTHAEADAARAAGAAIVSLGRRILRTETAALAILAVLAYESGA
jgi:16S rRNA (uracil1498-N3)-methyltransferase